LAAFALIVLGLHLSDKWLIAMRCLEGLAKQRISPADYAILSATLDVMRGMGQRIFDPYTLPAFSAGRWRQP